jgi:hemoglobin-like flavoprotein
MFIMAVAYCVGSLHQFDAIRGNLEKLAVRHVDYGALPEHYEIVGGALMRMLARVLGDDFTPEAKGGWSQAYQNLSSVMLDAAAQHLQNIVNGETSDCVGKNSASFWHHGFGRTIETQVEIVERDA